jgi:hypothetical protein
VCKKRNFSGITHWRPDLFLGCVTAGEAGPTLGRRLRGDIDRALWLFVQETGRMAADAGKKKSDIVRELVDEALAGRTADGMKKTKRK